MKGFTPDLNISNSGGIEDVYEIEEVKVQDIAPYIDMARNEEFSTGLSVDGFVHFDNYIPNIEMYVIKDYPSLRVLQDNKTIIVGDVNNGLWEYQEQDGYIIALRKKDNNRSL